MASRNDSLTLPYVTVTTDHPLASPDQRRLVTAIGAATSEALGHPEAPCIRLLEIDSARFVPPPSVEGPFALVEVTLMAGRSADTKRKLYRSLQAALAEVGIAARNVRVLLHCIPAIDVCVGNGQSAADVDLGYTVEV